MTLRMFLNRVLDTDVGFVSAALFQVVEFFVLLVLFKAALMILMICFWGRRQGQNARRKGQDSEARS